MRKWTGSPGAGERSGNRRRRLRRSIGFAIAALYLLFAVTAVLVSHHFGVAPARDVNDRRHAEHVAELVFQSLYSLMLSGAGREDLQVMALRLESTGPGISIRFVRGERVAAQYGQLRDSMQLMQTNPGVREAFRTGETQWRSPNDTRQIAYPAMFRPACADCHDDASAGEVAGVIVVDYADRDDDSLPPMLLPLLILLVLGLPVTLIARHMVAGRDP